MTTQRGSSTTPPTSGRVSKQEWTYGILRDRILMGTYGPGHRLVISALARELKVSPMPIREAIRRLEAERWVVYHRNQGAQVAPLEESAWKEAMVMLAALEGFITATVEPDLTAEDFARMRELNEQMRTAMANLDVMRFSECNHAFHEVLYARCTNSYVYGVLERTLQRVDALRSTIFMFIPTRGPESCEEHDQLIEMLERGEDPREVEHFAREHKLHTLRAYEERQAERNGAGQSLAGAGSIPVG